MVELSVVECCSAGERESCCDPEDRAACCGESRDQCGCAPSEEGDDRERSAAE